MAVFIVVCNEKDSHWIVWVVVDILGNNDYKAMELWLSPNTAFDKEE